MPALGRLLDDLRGRDDAPRPLECRDVRYSFKETVAVDGLSLSVRAGEIFGLLGPNGAGKTTTIRAITALLPVPAGTISVFGLDVARRAMAVRRLIGYVPQMLSADAALSGRENVSLFARFSTCPAANGPRRSTRSSP